MSFSIPTLRPSKITQAVSGRDWSNFCLLFNNSNAGGAGILINGIEANVAPLVYSSSFAVNFSDYIYYLIEDYGVTVSYEIDGGGGPGCSFSPITGTVTLGMSDITVNHPGGSCEDPLDMWVLINVTGMPVDFWQTQCCDTYGRCSNTGTFYSITNTITFDP